MKQLIDLKALSKIKDLPLVAKTIAQGFLQGHHKSFQRGVGIEFSQYRSYEPGDPLSKVDWKLFARSDRYFVREAERESDINVWFIIDTSASMKALSAPENEQSVSKIAYAKMLVATLAFLAKQQGDNVGLLLCNSQQMQFLPAVAGDKHFRKLLLLLSQMTAQGQEPNIEMLHQYIAPVQKQGLVFVVSDFYPNKQQPIEHSPWEPLLKRVKGSATDVVAIKLCSNQESQFNHKGAVRFKDLETGQEILHHAEQAKSQYLTNLEQFNRHFHQFCQQHHIAHWQMDVDQSMDESLFRFMHLRLKGLC